MAKKIELALSDGLRVPTEEDIKDAKRYVLLRSEMAKIAQEDASDIIMDAVDKLVAIAYKYNIPARDFQFDASVNEQMMEEVDSVMEELDYQLYDMLEADSTTCTVDGNRKLALIALLLTLGHRNMGLRETLYAYEWRMLRQVEAAIAALKAAGISKTEAMAKIKPSIGSLNTMPELVSARRFPQYFSAPYIKNGGRATYPDGTPNVQGVPVEGYNAIKFIYGTAVAQIWMKNRLMDMQDSEEIVGYYVLRGSEYPCALCDSYVGFHLKEEEDDYPPYHPNCCCYTVPVQRNEIE